MAALAVKALFFDVFGTLVDWRNSIAREAEALLKPKGITLDYFAFADAWRGEYQGAMEEVRAGRIGSITTFHFPCKLLIYHDKNSGTQPPIGG
jgi:FMN phosphatase YigB (HAD superfamily)